MRQVTRCVSSKEGGPLRGAVDVPGHGARPVRIGLGLIKGTGAPKAAEPNMAAAAPVSTAKPRPIGGGNGFS